MKLSTAIRIGSMTTQKITGRFHDGGNGRCALGAAADAMGCTMKQLVRNGFGTVCKAFSDYPSDLLHDVWMMNDGYGEWTDNKQTREQIADYLEAWENEHDGYLQMGVTEAKPLELIAQEAK